MWKCYSIDVLISVHRHIYHNVSIPLKIIFICWRACMTHWCITSTDLAHQTELNTRGHACSLVIVKNKAFEISARGVSGRWQWERDMQAVLTAGLFCWIGSGRTVSLFIPSFFSCSMVRPLLIYNHNPKKTERDWVGKKRVWGVMSKMLHSDVMLDYTVMYACDHM